MVPERCCEDGARWYSLPVISSRRRIGDAARRPSTDASRTATIAVWRVVA
jgi:hypothetical protein